MGKQERIAVYKMIRIDQLKIGMYVYDLNLVWPEHPFAWHCFTIEDADTLNRIMSSGVREIEIDPAQGADVELYAEPLEIPVPEVSSLASFILSKLSPAEEFEHARQLYSNASKLMQDIMSDVRLGKQVELGECSTVVDNIFESMNRCPSVVLPLMQMKNRDQYTFQHSVAVSALSVILCQVLELPESEHKEVALGGILHDIGKAKIPAKILNKPGKLDEAEFEIIKTHVVNTAEILKGVEGISDITFNAAAQHHERFDGSGYPHGLSGDQITLHGQIIATVDVYDAMTSVRVYHQATPPAEALKKMFQWRNRHFDSRLIQAFIKGVGIYPAGSLVRTDSGKLGIVREVIKDKLLQPVVEIIYDAHKTCYLPPETVNFSDTDEKIISHESFEKWGIDQAKWCTTFS